MLLSAAGTARGCFPTEPGNPRPALRAPPGERAAAWVRGPVCSLEPRAVTTASGHPSCWVVFKTQVTYFGGVVQAPSHVQLSATPWAAARQASLSLTIFQSLPKLMSIESVMPSDHLILCHPLFLLPSIFPRIRVFSDESVLHIKWPKYCIQLRLQSFQ